VGRLQRSTALVARYLLALRPAKGSDNNGHRAHADQGCCDPTVHQGSAWPGLAVYSISGNPDDARLSSLLSSENVRKNERVWGLLKDTWRRLVLVLVLGEYDGKAYQSPEVL